MEVSAPLGAVNPVMSTKAIVAGLIAVSVGKGDGKCGA